MTGIFRWSIRSKKEMQDIHPDLRRVCDLALQLSELDFVVIDGRRSLEEQRKHLASGASKTLKSRHLHGFAVDIVPRVDGKIRWEEAYFLPIAKAFKQAAIQLRVPIVWGGDWKGSWDKGHFELRKQEYPDP